MALFLVISQANFIGTVKADEDEGNERRKSRDLVIAQNIPQLDTEVNDGKVQLNALRIMPEGHFIGASNIAWMSSNKKVAQVDQNGLVTMTGHKGKAFIYVFDRNKNYDRISIQHHKGQMQVIKEKGKHYNVIENAISKMTLEEKVGQMLMPDFRTWKGQNVTQMLPEIEQLVKQYHLGGVILFRENVVTTEQTARLVSSYQQAAEKFGLLMTIDQEGGIITRLQSGTDMPGNMALGASRSEELTGKVAKAIGEELYSLGINMDLAPVLDVNNNPDNPVIGVRSFGEDPELVAQMGNAYIKGLQDSGVAATAKHFPGHGDTSNDSHLQMAVVPHDIERLKRVELYPFQKAMDAGIDAVMTAHVTFPKVDGTKVISQLDGTEIALPATLSHKVLTGLMREDMGFEGVIITDAMNMKAISDHFGPVDAAIRSVKAGTDIVLMPVGLKEVAEGLFTAVENGEITEERIDASVKRILTLKLNRGIVKQETEKSIDQKVQNALAVVGSSEHKAIEREAAAKSVTLIKNDSVLPVKVNPEDKMVVVGNLYTEDLVAQLKKHHANVTLIKTSAAQLTQAQLSQLDGAKYIIVGSNVSGKVADNNQVKLANQILGVTDAPVIGVAIRNPYDIMGYPNVDAYIAQYGFRAASFEATANTIFGTNNPAGKLPVTIKDNTGGTLYGFGHGLNY
ncbi:beta-N-acetylhexosaminidase [Bacillus sp. T33-2]|nr:beta-N-acetylhexosaminidase [Bacillus sp. T33-2]